MHTYRAEHVAGRWLLKSDSGEAIFTADDYDAAVMLTRAIARGGDAKVIVADAQNKNSTEYYCIEGVEHTKAKR